MTVMTVRLPVLVAGVVLAFGAGVSRAESDTRDLSTFSLEDLMQVEVTSVSKKPQRLANVAAAVFVITAEDIRRSGANSIPEALRLAPGVDATRISGSRWAVSMRGFAGRFANKLLVLVDGRNVYNPAFSGVLWEDLQMPLEDIERIEVIRGPGSAVWGTNAINGVINIITKSPAATQGGQVVAGGGRVEGAFGRVRWGGANQDGSLFYRIYATSQDGNAQQLPGDGSATDAYRQRGAGFRVDGYLTGNARWNLSGDLYATQNDQYSLSTLPWATAGQGTERHHGGSLRAQYEKTFDDGSSVQIQGAFAQSMVTIPNLTSDDRRTFDFGFQHRFRIGERHDVVWGADYRQTSDTMGATPFLMMNEASKQLDYYSLFAQDEINLSGSLHLTLGARLDHNAFTGWATLPTAQLSWNLAPNHTLWASASRADRAPSRGEMGLILTNSIGLPPTMPPSVTRVHTAGDFGDERLSAYELGWRSQWSPTVTSDVVAFTHRYDRLSIGTPPTLTAVWPYLVWDAQMVNGGRLTLDGVELATDWRPVPVLRFQVAYTYQRTVDNASNSSSAEGTLIPRQIASVRGAWTPVANLSVDFWWRHTGERRSSTPGTALARQAFSAFDLRVAWKLRRDTEIAIVGQNLGDSVCDAYSRIALPLDGSLTRPSCMPRAAYAEVRWDF